MCVLRGGFRECCCIFSCVFSFAQASLPLKPGVNEMVFSITTKFQVHGLCVEYACKCTKLHFQVLNQRSVRVWGWQIVIHSMGCSVIIMCLHPKLASHRGFMSPFLLLCRVLLRHSVLSICGTTVTRLSFLTSMAPSQGNWHAWTCVIHTTILVSAW